MTAQTYLIGLYIPIDGVVQNILGQYQHASDLLLILVWFPHTRRVAIWLRYSPQDDKKSSIASESHQDEAGGRRDSFESEDMPIEPIENQTAYAKSNIIKGEILFSHLPYFTLSLSRANSEERVKPAGKCTARSANPVSSMCSLPTKSEQRQTEATQERSTNAKSPKGELDEFCGRAGVSIPIKFSQQPQLAGCRREIQIVRPCSMCGQQKDSVPAIVVSREEIETNPAFAEFRAYRAQMENMAYRRSSRTGRKSSNCLSSSSQVKAVVSKTEYEVSLPL